MIICPNCKKEFDRNLLSCGSSACLEPKFGVARLLRKEFADRLFEFEKNFVRMREEQGIRIKDKSLYKKMPFLNEEEGRGLNEWKGFIQDLELIDRLVDNRKGQKSLNYGSWNGWLSNQLVNRGYTVTAVGYFIDEYDGLGSQQHYENDWLSIQMDIEHDLLILDEKYDLIVLNRGVSFLEDPQRTCQQLIEKLLPNGIMLITGMNVYTDPAKVKKKREDHLKFVYEKYGFELKISNTKSYLDKSDLEQLKKLGIITKRYSGSLLQNLKAELLPTYPLYLYGIYRN